jgi:hypothetical protein
VHIILSSVYEQNDGKMPEYDILSSITQPLLIVHGTDDFLAAPKQILELVQNAWYVLCVFRFISHVIACCRERADMIFIRFIMNGLIGT